jgi:flavin-binding protein dodecin
MKDHVYKLIELTGTSTTSIEDAVEKAIKRAHKTIKNLCWFQVVETRGDINKGEGGSLARARSIVTESPIGIKLYDSRTDDTT